MEGERMFNITENFRVLLREVNRNTYVAFESNGQTFVIYADTWEKLKPYLHEVDKEFIERCNFKEEKYRVFNIADDFEILIGEDKTNTHLVIKSGDQSIKLNADKWTKFKETFCTISSEFDKRFSDTLNSDSDLCQ